MTDPLEFLADEEKKKQLSRAELLKIQEEEDEREIAELMGLKRAKMAKEEDVNDEDESVDEEDEYVSEEDDESKPSSSNPGPSTSTSSLYSSIKTQAASSKPNSLYSSIKKQAAPKPKSLLPGIILKKPTK